MRRLPEELLSKSRVRQRRHYWSHRDQIIARYKESHLAAKRRRREAGRQLVNSIKANPCLDCGGRFPAECMDFDHRPGEGKYNTLSKLVNNGRNIDTLLKEIAKCDLVCSNCHRIRTKRRLHEAQDAGSEGGEEWDGEGD